MRTPWLAAAAAVLFSLASGPAARAAEQAPRRLLVAVEARGDGWTATAVLQVSRSLLHAIGDSGARILLLDWGGGAFPADGQLDPATRQRVDCWLLVSLQGSAEEPTVRVRSRDLLTGELTIDLSTPLGSPLDPPDIPAVTWKPLVDRIVATYPPVNTDAPLASIWAQRPPMWSRSTATLTVSAVPGSTIAGLDGDPVTVGESGTAALRVRSPATYELVASRPGYLPLRERVYVETDRELSLRQERAPRFGVDAGLASMSYPSLQVTGFAVPGWLFARLGVMSYLGGLAFTSEQVFWTEPLSTAWVQLGTYAVLPPQSVIRAYLASGAFIRVVHPAGTTPSIDALAPWGVQVVVGVEGSPWPRSRFFLEWSPTEYVTKYPDLFAAILGDATPPSMQFTPSAVLDFGAMRLGWRWSW